MSFDLTPVFNEALARHNAPPIVSVPYSLDDIEEFLKEAYRIVSRPDLRRHQ